MPGSESEAQAFGSCVCLSAFPKLEFSIPLWKAAFFETTGRLPAGQEVAVARRLAQVLAPCRGRRLSTPDAKRMPDREEAWTGWASEADKGRTLPGLISMRVGLPALLPPRPALTQSGGSFGARPWRLRTAGCPQAGIGRGRPLFRLRPAPRLSRRPHRRPRGYPLPEEKEQCFSALGARPLLEGRGVASSPLATRPHQCPWQPSPPVCVQAGPPSRRLTSGQCCEDRGNSLPKEK